MKFIATPRVLLPLVLATATINLLMLLSYWPLSGPPARQVPSYMGSDYPETLPIEHLGKVWLTTEESSRYPLLGDRSDEEWLSLTSAGYGYAHLGPHYRLFAVTMFHELHCLRVFNFAFGRSNNTNMHHVRHCLGYLRTMILCASDTTLEPGRFTDDGFIWDKEGEATHVCDDWEAVYAQMEESQRGWMNFSATPKTR